MRDLALVGFVDEAGVAVKRKEEPNLQYTFIPYYWLVLGYVVGWTGLLMWRKRKFEKRPVA